MFFNRSISIDSTNEEVYFKIAELKLFLGDYKDVFKNINKGLRINERKPEAYFMKGVAYKHIGDTNKAISSFKTAIELKPDFAKVYYELGLLLTLKSDSSAIDYYKRGIEISANDAGLKYSLAWSYDQFNKLIEADKAYNNVVSEYPLHIEAKRNYATFKYNLNQLDTALLLCNQVLDCDSLNSFILNLKGMILKEKGRLKESEKIRDKLLLINSQLEL
jgi:tetratricopeptide (TPR) repeat protein